MAKLGGNRHTTRYGLRCIMLACRLHSLYGKANTSDRSGTISGNMSRVSGWAPGEDGVSVVSNRDESSCLWEAPLKELERLPCGLAIGAG